jgi:putative NIF3 family GTP cyclohydrolase 1 type 2
MNKVERQMATDKHLVRTRWLAGIAALLCSTSAVAQEKRVTARDVIACIQLQVEVSWAAETVDTFKAGDPDTAVTGIAVTMMATMDVLQRAAASGKNLIITHEPTFYNHLDKLDVLEQKENDPVLAAKLAFIAKHNLVVWRFHDHWHRRKPDGVVAGMVHALGWEKYQDAKNEHLFTIPETTVEKLSVDLKAKLSTHAMRVVADPHQKVKRVALVPGSSGFVRETHALEMPDVDILLTGEPREWETVEYVADAVTQKKGKGLIILGHIPSEQAGMEECARWLKSFVSEVPIEFVPAADPFWKN